jgi:hypothetical protein
LEECDPPEDRLWGQELLLFKLETLYPMGAEQPREVQEVETLTSEMDYQDPSAKWQKWFKWIEQTEKLQGKNESSEQAHLQQLQQFKADSRVFIFQSPTKTVPSECLRELHEPSELKSDVQESSSIQAINDEKLETVYEDTKTNPQLMGRRKIMHWKASAGRAKEWRQRASIKVATKRQRHNPGHPLKKRPSISLNTVDSVTRRLGTEERTFNPAIPAIALKFSGLESAQALSTQI